MSALAVSRRPRVLALAIFVLSLGMIAFAMASLVVWRRNARNTDGARVP
jgi:hypothetical protein